MRRYKGYEIIEHPYWRGRFRGQHEDFDYTVDEGPSHPVFEGLSKEEVIEQIDEWYEEEVEMYSFDSFEEARDHGGSFGYGFPAWRVEPLGEKYVVRVSPGGEILGRNYRIKGSGV